MRNFISPIISERKPEFLKREYRNFSRFIDNFYSFLESEGNPLDILENFYERCEPNNEFEGYIDKILKECGFDIQKELTITKKELILHLRDFYLSRGSEDSFKFLFKIIYGCDITIDYPRKRMLIPSQASYSGRYFIFTTTQNVGTSAFETILGLSDSYDLILKGISSKTECSVESISIVHSKDLTYLKIQIDESYRVFQKGEGIEIISQSTGIKIIENFVDNLGISIINPGKGYKIGDKIIIDNAQILGNARVKTLKEGSISDIQIDNGGNGYSVGDQILTGKRTKGHSFSAVVSKVDNSNNYLEIPSISEFDLTQGDFTIEMWINMPTSISDSILLSNKLLNTGWTLKTDGINKLVFILHGNTNQVFTSTRSVQFNKWSHIAVTRQGNTLKTFIDGTKTSEDSITDGVLSNSPLRIGIGTDNLYPFIGYLDELRLTNGVVRYTNNFILPEKAFDELDAYFSDVSLLIHFSGLNNSSVFEDSSSLINTINTHGSIYLVKDIIHYQKTSGYFSGLGSIQRISIYNHGYNYDALPTFYITSKFGTGAILTPLSNTIGQIESIEIVDPFVDSFGTPNINVESVSGTGAVLSAIPQSVFLERPSWKSFEGVLGINSTLLDSYYYQQYSYYVYSPVSKKEYDSIVDEWVHPAGFVRFSILDISYSGFVNPPNGGFDSKFYLTIIKIIFGRDDVFMINPIYNLHWFKELSDKNFTNWVSGFDWILEEWTNDASYYMSQALDISPVTKYYTIRDHRVLLNPQSGLDWFKNSEYNYSYTANVWDDFVPGDRPLNTNDPSLLSRKRVTDDTLIMSKALDAEIEINNV